MFYTNFLEVKFHILQETSKANYWLNYTNFKITLCFGFDIDEGIVWCIA